ncbi:response regulator [Marispirochaeta aestuarii]|uniref:response regulator n=1 Tax=Marispirochaeta aestuarii TaxID=1963862 RepID=UPI0029C67226|nr:response regulator [Marispirochaeta aestuarii]
MEKTRLSREEASPDISLNKVILIVEDEAIIALAEKRILEKAGYTVHVAYNGERAVELTESLEKIDLILMDIDLGHEPDGTETAERILTRYDIPIMFLSSHTEADIVERTEGITSYGYIVKHSGDTVLLASIRMAFRLYEARRSINEHMGMQDLILRVSECLAATSDLQTILQIASDNLAKLSGLNTGAIYTLDNGILTRRAGTPTLMDNPPEELLKARLQNHPHIRKALSRQEAIYIVDTESESLTNEERSIVKARHLKSILYIPLLSQGRSIGVFIAGTTSRKTSIKKTTILLCETLANIAALAAVNALNQSNRTE